MFHRDDLPQAIVKHRLSQLGFSDAQAVLCYGILRGNSHRQNSSPPSGVSQADSPSARPTEPGQGSTTLTAAQPLEKQEASAVAAMPLDASIEVGDALPSPVVPDARVEPEPAATLAQAVEWAYDSEGYDVDGYDANGYDRDGRDPEGYDDAPDGFANRKAARERREQLESKPEPEPAREPGLEETEPEPVTLASMGAGDNRQTYSPREVATYVHHTAWVYACARV